MASLQQRLLVVQTTDVKRFNNKVTKYQLKVKGDV